MSPKRSPRQLVGLAIIEMMNRPGRMCALYLAMVAGGAWIFSIVEHVDYATSLWWSFITVLTIGYGDVYPKTDVGRGVGIFMASVVIMVIIPIIVGQIIMKVLKDQNEFSHAEQEEMKERTAEIHRLVTKNHALLHALYAKNDQSPDTLIEQLQKENPSP